MCKSYRFCQMPYSCVEPSNLSFKRVGWLYFAYDPICLQVKIEICEKCTQWTLLANVFVISETIYA